MEIIVGINLKIIMKKWKNVLNGLRGDWMTAKVEGGVWVILSFTLDWIPLSCSITWRDARPHHTTVDSRVWD